ncbi:OadG family protein [Bacteroidota bacterium]
MLDNFSISNIFEGDGILISVIGYVIVFMALLLLFIFIANLQKILIGKQRKKLKAIGHSEAEHEDLTISGEVVTAIATALHLYFEEIHDFENTVLTIKKVQRPYSPWSSKLYGLRQYPQRHKEN